MTRQTARPRALIVATALLCAAGTTVAVSAQAAPGQAGAARSSRGGGLNAPVPSITSDNITQIAGIQDTAAISMEFAHTGPFAYVSSTDTITVLDLTDPRDPKVRGTLVNALFENESMTYGERLIDGVLNRFVIAAVDLVQAAPTDPTHVNLDDGPEVVLVDVTDPDNPFIRSRTPQGDAPGAATTSTHTVQCVDQGDCSYAYTAGTGSMFSILDLTDLDNPKQLKTVPSPASGPGDASEGQGFSRGAGHYWDFDTAGIGWHTGSGGAAAFDVRNPLTPLLLNATNALGRGAPINDFILHNSMRPNAKAFRAGAAPSIKNGNVLLVTEEDYADDGDEIICSEAGSFQTWYVPDLDGAAYRAKNADGTVQDVGTIAPLDQVNAPSDFGGGASLPATGFCSAHWFDVHQDGFVALGQYGAGLRIMDVRDPANIDQIGFVTGVATQVWDAYWVPIRDRAGVIVPGQKTNLVYTADAVRGIEVFEVALPAAAAVPGAAAPAPEGAPAPAAGPAAPSSGGGGSLAATGSALTLPLLAIGLLVGAAAAVRRRSAV